MANKTKIEFEGFEEVLSRLAKVEGNVKKTTETALKETHKIITAKADSAIKPHHLTGDTEKSLKRNAEVEWVGTIASVEVGFDISKGGLPSIFLMYGTPRMKKDQNLYNAFWSKKTKDEVKAAQEKIFYDELRRLNG